MSTTSSRRRWFQFRLRSLLVLLFLCALVLAWARAEVVQRHRETPIRKFITAAGGRVNPIECDSFGVPIPQEKSGWKSATDWCFGETVHTVDLSNRAMEDLAPLGDLEDLERLSLVNTYAGWLEIPPTESIDDSLSDSKPVDIVGHGLDLPDLHGIPLQATDLGNVVDPTPNFVPRSIPRIVVIVASYFLSLSWG